MEADGESLRALRVYASLSPAMRQREHEDMEFDDKDSLRADAADDVGGMMPVNSNEMFARCVWYGPGDQKGEETSGWAAPEVLLGRQSVADFCRSIVEDEDMLRHWIIPVCNRSMRLGAAATRDRVVRLNYGAGNATYVRVCASPRESSGEDDGRIYCGEVECVRLSMRLIDDGSPGTQAILDPSDRFSDHLDVAAFSSSVRNVDDRYPIIQVDVLAEREKTLDGVEGTMEVIRPRGIEVRESPWEPGYAEWARGWDDWCQALSDIYRQPKNKWAPAFEKTSSDDVWERDPNVAIVKRGKTRAPVTDGLATLSTTVVADSDRRGTGQSLQIINGGGCADEADGLGISSSRSVTKNLTKVTATELGDCSYSNSAKEDEDDVSSGMKPKSGRKRKGRSQTASMVVKVKSETGQFANPSPNKAPEAIERIKKGGVQAIDTIYDKGVKIRKSGLDQHASKRKIGLFAKGATINNGDVEKKKRSRNGASNKKMAKKLETPNSRKKPGHSPRSDGRYPVIVEKKFSPRNDRRGKEGRYQKYSSQRHAYEKEWR